MQLSTCRGTAQLCIRKCTPHLSADVVFTHTVAALADSVEVAGAVFGAKRGRCLVCSVVHSLEALSLLRPAGRAATRVLPQPSRELAVRREMSARSSTYSLPGRLEAWVTARLEFK